MLVHMYPDAGNVCPQPCSKRLPRPSMQSCAPLRSLLILLPFHRARHVQPVILAKEIETHIQHACGSARSRVPRLGIEPGPVGVVAVHALATRPRLLMGVAI